MHTNLPVIYLDSVLGTCKAGQCVCSEGQYTVAGCLMQAAMAAEHTRMKAALSSPEALAKTTDPFVLDAFRCQTSADCNLLGESIEIPIVL